MRVARWRKLIERRWRRWQVASAVSRHHGDVDWRLVRVNPLRRGARYGLWELQLAGRGGAKRRVVLKLLGPSRRMRIEENFYRKGASILAPAPPTVYACRTRGRNTWLFQEYVAPLAGRQRWTPETLRQVIPALARLHAVTYRPGGSPPPPAFAGWLPSYSRGYYAGSGAYRATRRLLMRALRRRRLASLLRPYHRLLSGLLRLGPSPFRELGNTGWAVIHCDLHEHNVCCNDLQADPWDIRLIDWESARYAPVWFDLIVLVEMQIDFHPNWRSRRREIRRQALADYLRSMERHGIRIEGPHLRLYRLAYLQRTLELGLRTQLRRALQGREAALLKPYLRKVRRWSRRLGIAPA